MSRVLAKYDITKGNTKRAQAEAQRLRDMIRAALPPVLSKLYQMALDGDVQAAKLLLDRALPPLAPVKEAPKARGETLKMQIADLLEQVTSGETTAKEAAQTIELLTQHAPRDAEGKTLSPDALRNITAALYGGAKGEA